MEIYTVDTKSGHVVTSLPSYDEFCEQTGAGQLSPSTSMTPSSFNSNFDTECAVASYDQITDIELNKLPARVRAQMDHFYPQVTVDTNNPIQTCLFDHLKDKSFLTWLELDSYRSPERRPFGSKSALSRIRRSPKTRQTNTSIKTSRDIKLENQKLDHSGKEQDRRERHAWWLRWMDELCADFHFRMAEAHMPNAKMAFGHAKLSHTPRIVKETGKDEVLLTCQFQMVMSRWINKAYKSFLRELCKHLEWPCVNNQFKHDNLTKKLALRRRPYDLSLSSPRTSHKAMLLD